MSGHIEWLGAHAGYVRILAHDDEAHDGNTPDEELRESFGLQISDGDNGACIVGTPIAIESMLIYALAEIRREIPERAEQQLAQENMAATLKHQLNVVNEEEGDPDGEVGSLREALETACHLAGVDWADAEAELDSDDG